jgi:hypothetical protein
MNHETAAGILNMGRQIDQIAQMHNSNREQVTAAIRECARRERAEL